MDSWLDDVDDDVRATSTLYRCSNVSRHAGMDMLYALTASRHVARCDERMASTGDNPPILNSTWFGLFWICRTTRRCVYVQQRRMVCCTTVVVRQAFNNRSKWSFCFVIDDHTSHDSAANLC